MKAETHERFQKILSSLKDSEMICQSCNQQMRLILKKKYKKYGTEKRIRKFYCEVCGISEVVYGTGIRDVKQNPLKLITNDTQNTPGTF